MSGFATHIKKRRAHPTRDDKASLERWRVIRRDGRVLGGSPQREVAERLARVIGQGQVPGYCRVETRGGQ